MPLLNDIHSIIVPASQANFTAHTYTEVYAGLNEVVVINNKSITLGSGSSIKLKVFQISASTGSTVVLLGENINNRMDNPIYQ